MSIIIILSFTCIPLSGFYKADIPTLFLGNQLFLHYFLHFLLRLWTDLCLLYRIHPDPHHSAIGTVHGKTTEKTHVSTVGAGLSLQ